MGDEKEKCPKCDGELTEYKKEKFRCQKCGTKYTDLETARKYHSSSEKISGDELKKIKAENSIEEGTGVIHKLGMALGMVTGASFILVGLVLLISPDSLLAGVFFTLSGLIIFPPFFKTLKKIKINLSNPVRIIGFVIFMAMAGAVSPPSENTGASTSDLSVDTSQETVEETQPPETTPAPTEPPLEILDISFYKFDSMFGTEGYLTDIQKEEKFEEEFEGKYVQWKCELVNVDESLFGGKYTLQMKCDPRTLASDMMVELRKDQNDKLMDIYKGDRVEFIAKLKSYSAFFGHSAEDGVIVD